MMAWHWAPTSSAAHPSEELLPHQVLKTPMGYSSGQGLKNKPLRNLAGSSGLAQETSSQETRQRGEVTHASWGRGGRKAQLPLPAPAAITPGKGPALPCLKLYLWPGLLCAAASSAKAPEPASAPLVDQDQMKLVLSKHGTPFGWSWGTEECRCWC